MKSPLLRLDTFGNNQVEVRKCLVGSPKYFFQWRACSRSGRLSQMEHCLSTLQNNRFD